MWMLTVTVAALKILLILLQLLHAGAQLTKITPYTAHERCVGLVELLRYYFTDPWATTEGEYCHFGASASFGAVTLIEHEGKSHLLRVEPASPAKVGAAAAASLSENAQVNLVRMDLLLTPELPSPLPLPNSKTGSIVSIACPNQRYTDTNLTPLASSLVQMLACSPRWLIVRPQQQTAWELKWSISERPNKNQNPLQQNIHYTILWGALRVNSTTSIEVRVHEGSVLRVNGSDNTTTIFNEARGRALVIKRRQVVNFTEDTGLKDSNSLFSYTYSSHLPRDTQDPRYAEFCGQAAAQYAFLGLAASHRIGVGSERGQRCVHEVRLGRLMRMTIVSGIMGTLQLQLSPPRRHAGNVPMIRLEQTECRVRIDCRPRAAPYQRNNPLQHQSTKQNQAFGHQQVFPGGPASCHNELRVEMIQDSKKGDKRDYMRFQYWDPHSGEVFARFGIVRDGSSSTLVYRSYLVTVTRSDIYIENMRREMQIGFVPMDLVRYQMFYSLNFDFPLPPRRIKRISCVRVLSKCTIAPTRLQEKRAK